MSDTAATRDKLRDRILAEPDVILEDPGVMRALVTANEKALGSNVVDLRGIAMERLESRLMRLEDTHRSVIAAAYENLAGTNQIHRAVLRMLEATDFTTFLTELCSDVTEILRVDSARLLLETDGPSEVHGLDTVQDVMMVVPAGYVDDYISQGRQSPIRPVTLRQLGDGEGRIYGDGGDWIRSEACLKLDFGAGRLPGMLAMGSEDPHQFTSAQGTDLLGFFAGSVERAMRRWLA